MNTKKEHEMKIEPRHSINIKRRQHLPTQKQASEELIKQEAYVQKSEDNYNNCMICASSLLYSTEQEKKECYICHKTFYSNCECENGHYVCDACHEASAIASFIPYLLSSDCRSPQRLFEQVAALKGIHMHGPEHHMIVPCVLLTAYKNCGGDIDLEASLKEAVKRGGQVPGGTCGYWGVCGAVSGAGIYLSIITGSNPLNKEKWDIPMKLTSRCIDAIAAHKGPRCCKRTSRIAIKEATDFTAENFGIQMEDEFFSCTFMSKNRECIHDDCPYFPGGGVKA